MEKILIPKTGGYKANLHCHSLDSDGRKSPEQLKKDYMEHGYSILAYTDHFYMRDRTYLNDENFVAISGYENDIIEESKDYKCKLYHLNFYSPTPQKVGMVGIAEDEYNGWMTNKTKEEIEKAPLVNGFCKNEYSIENINKIIELAKKEGYLVILNHPCWSNQTACDLVGIKGLTGMEIYNNGCFVEGYDEDNGQLYDAMLRDNQHIACFANDDNHNIMEDSYGGFNIIFSKSLKYADVFEAIQNKNLYASTGAYFKGVSIKDNKIYVGAENARIIRMTTNGRIAYAYFAKDKPLTNAIFDLPINANYFRITIENMDGKKAYTRAYFKEEW